MSDQLEDKSKAAKDIIDIIIRTSDNLDVSRAELLAEIMRQCLMSDGDNPNHINGIELISLCDKCLVQSDGYAM